MHIYIGLFPTDDNNYYMTSAEAGSDYSTGLNADGYSTSHYSFLKLIAENWGLDYLDRYDTWANAMQMPYTCYPGYCSGSVYNYSQSDYVASYYSTSRPAYDDSSSSSSYSKFLQTQVGTS